MDIDEDRNANGLRDAGETHPNLKDSDADGIEDHIEDRNLNFLVDIDETDPLDADSDDDGLSDGAEYGSNGLLDPNETNALVCDTDQDILPDGLENGVSQPIATFLLADTMMRNGTDLTKQCFKADLDPTTNSNPLSLDSDGDTLLDSQEDLNHNGKLDAPETSETDPNLRDTDGDGVDDLTDESPRNQFKCRDTEIYYAMGQALSEEPLKVGDGCDDCALGQVDALNDGIDTDTDSICDLTDNCLFNLNPNQIDLDSDAIGDACDFCNNNGQPDPNEECDDGNMFNCDSCTNECKFGPNLMFKTFKDFDQNPNTPNSFKMGSTVTIASSPVRNIALQDFQMAHREVTVADYKICQNANPYLNNGNICSPTAPLITGNTQCNYDKPTRQNHPINCITHEEAEKFANWCTASLQIHSSRKATLATEAQWEFVAKNSPLSYNDSNSNATYLNGNIIPACTNTHFRSGAGIGCGTGLTTEVCTKGAINAVDLANQPYKAQTADGLCDLAGNVSEWMMDSYAPYGNTNLDGSAFIGSGTQTSTKSVRGGSYMTSNSTVSLRTYGRASLLATTRSAEMGMRVSCLVTTVNGISVGCSTRCGDLIITDQETCDDGNLVNGDGCSMYCQTE
jgi:cysteine-rich repeat protein